MGSRGAVGLLLAFASVLAGAAASSAPPPAAVALPEQTVVAGPGAWLATYATPAVAVERGGALTFLNGDIMRHDVVAAAMGPDGQPWCFGSPPGACPLFWTDLIGLAEYASVQGLENLQPGAVYDFYCTAHRGMVGKLVALPQS